MALGQVEEVFEIRAPFEIDCVADVKPPASQRKRKRPQNDDRATAKRDVPPTKRKVTRDESISGSDVSDNEARAEDYGASQDSESESDTEDVSSKRIRLAEQYLANTQKEVLVEEGFDAADVDADNLRRRMGDRLKEDTAESKGKLYRWIAEEMAWGGAERSVAKMQGQSVTGVAVQGRFAYTVSKDLAVSKWEMPTHEAPMRDGKQVGRVRSTPKRVAYSRGVRSKKQDRDYVHHTGAILCVAASQDGKFVATGGLDKRIVVWDAATLKPLKVFTQHRDTVSSLAFRRGTNQLFSASRDRTVKIWSLDELAYVETLFGHQDEVVDVSALAQEKCITVGARDRTARQWKVVEESQLVFRGGGAPGRSKADRSARGALDPSTALEPEQKAYNEGSMDRVACIDDETFITGSDNGSLSLWNVHKKKAVFTYPLAHGLDPPLPLSALSAEEHPTAAVQGEPQPRWITALRAIPFSDTFVSGSWDGVIRVWRISEDKRRIESLGVVGPSVDGMPDLLHTESVSSETLSDHSSTLKAPQQSPLAHGPIVGVINDLAIVDRGERAKDGVLIAAAVGKQHRLGRWSEFAEGKNCLVIFEVPRKMHGAVNTGMPEAAVDRNGQVSPEAVAKKADAPEDSARDVEDLSPVSRQVLRETSDAAGTSHDGGRDASYEPAKDVEGEGVEDTFAGFDD
ncbi:pre-rRNA processing protein [Friedmanniomyces endolithicus]|uniref:Pre-rRNA processing protein n=1 Tax=Friedmanniomyces endolithicus TaxID=329885 RepID=A0AAN6J9V6_9PEZI|nr:pre-rRNA processing protein [Friedmanniomyces endolithicus]